ncbi:hypothetical protein D9613_003264 [Agrocybe pediades]|uniref:Uncharacterized protein n=1 Tax=Agrocybe pediades TaxID=84607 RepID=A0A8H4QQ62_9AGAR|nr:hypothetical protein D9613_003264 [Agrocybe pediades]
MMSRSTLLTNNNLLSDTEFVESSEDEIVLWGVSDAESIGDSQVEVSFSSSSGEEEGREPGEASDDDFVLLSRPRPTGTVAAAAATTTTARNATRTVPEAVQLQTNISTPVRDEGFGLRTPVTASNARLVTSLESQMGKMSLGPSSPDDGNAVTTTLEKSQRQELKPEKVQDAQATTAHSVGRPEKNKKKKKKKAARRAEVRKKAEMKKLEQLSGARPSVASTAKPSHYLQTAGGHDWFEEMSIVRFTGLGSRPIVDDYSDQQSVVSTQYDLDYETGSSVGGAAPTLYEEASTFISSFLSNPDAKNDTICRLTLLQSLIIELGLAPTFSSTNSTTQQEATSSLYLPTSLKSAKAFLKSRAFLNIREYIAVREQGPEAVQKVLHPSKKALIRDLQKNRKKKINPESEMTTGGRRAMSLQWVKQHGLQVLLVGWNNRY